MGKESQYLPVFLSGVETIARRLWSYETRSRAIPKPRFPLQLPAIALVTLRELWPQTEVYKKEQTPIFDDCRMPAQTARKE